MQLAPYIDHTLLKATATLADIRILCEEARQHSFYAVCINPVFIPHARAWLEGSDVKVATVCGFPLGAVSSEQKALEARLSAEAGADEIDMVIHVGSALAGDWDAVEADVRAVRRAVPEQVLKVIIETCYLSDEQKRRATEAAVQGGADFVKTSTGFGTGGATVEDVKLMAEVIAGRAQIKAAGGVRTPADAQAMIEAGATRLGTSGGVGLVSGGENGAGY
ncbi:deoxyribose-phosphate aldolase [Deinococcus wulumuqiensis]|uniref:Deoxyribose-phosphate aldolase n=1 Tax=Deinococcus wulumuqiensis TaxID=980427 RepID=A0AAV4K4V3_9DEIO|nr:deoxyribose-phosphate aldolase [Deinococcus wulumuqiensis]QII20377.1 deoxyribose-phosphate aldolase [Deinococcus wulumuqiensis R12]GGI82307.1 deoxyribose-phosphate aldolase [Deinococcus wulumuqiensis]GGP29442.1 deoxyribose-phosphate aldolase [Deinococcus wulumuqiensis]